MAKFTEQEKQSLVAVFEGLDVKPDTSDPESMTQWMKQYLHQKGRLKDLPAVDSSRSIQGDSHLLQTPRVVTFSGDEQKDARFDIWKYEVLSMVKEKTYSLSVISNAARKSLRGEAARVVMRLGEDASLDDIIVKLTAVYGTVESSECLLADFYSACQKEGESVANWACRLEDLLSNIDSKNHIKSSDEMLKAKFWSGLLPTLKDASRHKFDSVKKYQDLLVELRRIESDKHKAETNTTSTVHKTMSKASQKTDSQGNSDMSELKAMVKALTDKMSNQHTPSGKPDNTSNPPYAPNSNPRGFGYRGTRRGGRFFGRGRGRGNSNSVPEPLGEMPDSTSDLQSEPRKPITCWRCGKEGHLRIGCREPLN